MASREVIEALVQVLDDAVGLRGREFLLRATTARRELSPQRVQLEDLVVGAAEDCRVMTVRHDEPLAIPRGRRAAPRKPRGPAASK